MTYGSRVPWYFVPFIWLWRLAGIITGRLGKRASLILGTFLVVIGAMNCLSIVGAWFGVPVLLVGGAVLLRALIPPRR